MNEIILSRTNELGKGVLGTTTNKIITLSTAEINSAKHRAVLIAKVVNEKLFEKGGFENPSQWAEKYLDMNKSTLSRIVKTANRFSNDPEKWNSYTLSQLFEMNTATDEKLERCNITPEMSCAKIREAIKNDGEMIDVAPETETAENPKTETAETVESFDTETPNDENEVVEFAKPAYADVIIYLKKNKKCVVEYNEETETFFVCKISD